MNDTPHSAADLILPAEDCSPAPGHLRFQLGDNARDTLEQVGETNMASQLERAQEIRKQMERAELSRIVPAVLKLLQPSIRLRVVEESTQPVTRLGGAPNLPADIVWPARGSGDPHSFLAQIDLAQLWAVEGLPLPSSGSLFFFCDAAYLPDDSDPRDIADGIKVVYCASSLAENPLRTLPRELDAEVVFKGFSFRSTPDLTAPAQDVWEIESLCLSDAESDSYNQVFSHLSTGDGSVHRLGGYPNLVQYGRLELSAELASRKIDNGNSNGVGETRSRGLDAGAADWRLLLQLDSEEKAGMMWGDVGKLYFMIRESDLKALRFDRVWMSWQCG